MSFTLFIVLSAFRPVTGIIFPSKCFPYPRNTYNSSFQVFMIYPKCLDSNKSSTIKPDLSVLNEHSNIHLKMVYLKIPIGNKAHEDTTFIHSFV